MTGYSYKKTLVYDPSKSETYRAIQEEGYGNADYTQEVTVPVQTKVFHPNRMVPGKVRSEQLVIDYNLQKSTSLCLLTYKLHYLSHAQLLSRPPVRSLSSYQKRYKTKFNHLLLRQLNISVQYVLPITIFVKSFYLFFILNF